MKISEIFYSIQGEGKRTGSPSFFIRTNHCNLRCKFSGGNLCDTSYTSWFPDDEKNLGETDLKYILDEYRKINCMDVVITGGEPTMYPEELQLLCKELKKINGDLVITVETNGTGIGEFIKDTDLISISPKLKSSVPYNTEYEKMHLKNRMSTEILKNFNTLKQSGSIDIQWKFVFTGNEDINEILNLQTMIGFENKDIYLMPEGITIEDLNRNRPATIEACLSNRFNYTDRIHIIAWGNKRGV